MDADSIDLYQASTARAQQAAQGAVRPACIKSTREAKRTNRITPNQEGGSTMFRYAFVGLTAIVLIAVNLVPDDAFARRGGGGGFRGGGGFHGGGMRAAHVRGGAVHAGRYAHVSRPIAGRPVARAAAARGVYRGAAYRGAYRGAAYGAAAVGAAAAGAYGYNYYNNYYNNGCYRDTYGNVVCPNQYQY
jgi:hypothetical protein